MKKSYLLLILILFILIGVSAQESQNYQVIIDQIGNLESNKDPKCYATASRLEDFIYGTPLTDEARFTKTYLQKQLVLSIWVTASSLARQSKKEIIEQDHLLPIFNGLIGYSRKNNGDLDVSTASGERLLIKSTDLRQYGSIAYAYRAVLAVQQDIELDSVRTYLPFSEEALSLVKSFLDIYTLCCLQIADREARIQNKYEITNDMLVSTWYSLLPPGTKQLKGGEELIKTGDQPKSNFEILHKIIDQKIKSYEIYNDLNGPIFLRNIQVYFARHKWPIDSIESNNLKSVFADAMIFFVKDLMKISERKAQEKNHIFIRVDDIHDALFSFLPYEINEYEDVIFFPKLPNKDQITIEAYDLDAFRDSGIHWLYLNAALEESEQNYHLEPDPFASELLVESIAHMGVLVLRVAGKVAKDKNVERLHSDHIREALKRIQALINEHAIVKNNPAMQEEISSSLERPKNTDELYFEDITTSTGIHFMHRSADWLSRLIRSYVFKADENLARIAIPPAFGGSGIASEDINNDGYPDVLALSGIGNKLYLNNKDGSYTDITEDAGLEWIREDGTSGEPRQPIIADFDNDGLQDIFISYVDDDHRMYRNLGNAKFEDVTINTNLGGKGLVAGPCTAIDYDKDGLLDIYIGYFGNYLNGELPTLARNNENGTPNKLFKNLGHFRFADVSHNCGAENKGWTQAVGHTDINLDGWQDIIVGNDFGVNSYYINRGDGTFVDKGAEYGTDKPSYTMNVGIADLNRDQFPDFYISNIVVMEKDEKFILPDSQTPMRFNPETMAHMRVAEANDLFISSEEGGNLKNYINSKLIGRGYTSTGWSWDADFFDFDNDGDEDLYCLNGMNDFRVYSSDNPYYMDPEGEAKNVLFAESSKETNVFFENTDGMLQNVSNQSGLNLLNNSRSAAYLDYDLDGDLDVVLNNYHGEAYFYRNKSESLGNSWLKVRLKGDISKKSTADAIGARILVSSEHHKNIWREVHSTDGYLSGHPKEMHLGLGRDPIADVVVYWPDGSRSEFKELKANQRYLIKQKGEEIVQLNN